MDNVQILDEQKYWDELYKSGWGSGAGSRGNLLDFKAKFLNDCFQRNEVNNVFDFGCGDGQLAKLLKVKRYCGVDVSGEAVKICSALLPQHSFQRREFESCTPQFISSCLPEVECCMCIDVLYHIMQDSVLEATISNLFRTRAKLVVLYTVPDEQLKDIGIFGGVRYRKIGDFLRKHSGSYQLVQVQGPPVGTKAHFFVFKSVI